MKVPGLVLAPFLLQAVIARADPESFEPLHFYAGFGMIAQDAQRLSASQDGSSSIFTSTYLELEAQGQYEIGAGFGVSPLVTWTPISRTTPDKGATSRLFNVALRAMYGFGASQVFLGPGALLYSINGSGGTTTQQNGMGTMEYALPTDSRTAINYLWDLGYGYRYLRFRGDLDLLVTGTFSDRRAVNILFTVGYGLI